ncbi:MAG: TRAP transporter small permease [Rhodobacteraceae bacterium]|nr:TRAP transporter small permease [Paracoccaceae bacterium]
MSGLFAKIEFAVGVILLATITFLVFIAALMRHFGHPLIWSVDMAQLLFIWLCFVGATRALRERGHLGVDFLVRLFSYKNRLRIETALAALFIVFLMTLAKVGVDLTLLNIERLFGDSGISYAFVTSAVPVGCVFLSLAIIANTVEAWRSAKSTQRLIFARTANDGDTSRSEL